MDSKQALENFKRKQEQIKAGQVRSINDAATRGHKSIITKKKEKSVQHLPITHASETRNMKNIKLNKNPDPNDKSNKKYESYILPKVQETKYKNVGKEHPDVKVKDPRDKSIIRHLKKQSKNK